MRGLQSWQRRWERQIKRPSRPLGSVRETEIDLVPAWEEGKPEESNPPLWRKRDVGVSTDTAVVR